MLHMEILKSKRWDPKSIELINYALELINNDREEHNLSTLNLSNDTAAQRHSDDLLAKRIQYPSHWSTDGMKPYMKSSIYNGTGYIEQNVAIRGYDNTTIQVQLRMH